MTRISLLLLLFLLISCGGQRGLFREISNTRRTNNDCKTLFKKQNLQYKLAVREGKANQRRRSSILPKNKPDERGNEVASKGGPHVTTYTKENISAHDGTPQLISLERGDSATSHLSDFTAFTSPCENTSLKIQSLEKNLAKSTMKEAAFTNFNSSSLPLLLVGMAGLTGMVLLRLFQGRAQQLSRWAKNYPWTSRGAIAVAQIGMGVSSLWLGNHLFEAGIVIPDYARLSAAGMFAVAAIFYPATYHANGSPAFSYLRRKFHDAALFTTGAMLTVYAGNHYHFTIQSADSIRIVASTPSPKQKIFSVKFANHQVSVIKNKFEATLKKHFEDPKGKTRGEKAALVILVSLGFAFLTVGVAAISCNLSCSGNEAAAVGVLIAGAAIIAWGLSSSLKRIHRAPTIEKKTKVEPSPQT